MNYEGEYLWLVVSRVHPDECVDLCYDQIGG